VVAHSEVGPRLRGLFPPCRLAFTFRPSRIPLESSSFSKQIFEGLAGVVGPRGFRRGLFLHGHARSVEGAIVLSVFLSDPFQNRLRAFEPACRIEISALLAAMEFKSAARAFSPRVKIHRENRPAAAAARNGMSPRHHRRLGADSLRPRTLSLPGRLLRPLPARILVTPLPILSVAHEWLPRSSRPCLLPRPYSVLPPRPRKRIPPHKRDR